MKIKNGLLLILLIQWVNYSKSNKEEQIKKLEKEKEELFLQIQKGISDSIKTLRNDNNTDAILGITYLTELRDKITKLNETEDFNNTNTKEVRRNFEDGRRKKFNVNLGDISYLFTTKGFNTQNVREDNRALLQKKLNDWIKDKEEEKGKIKSYKNKIKGGFGSAKKEKCPRFGTSKGKKNSFDGRKRLSIKDGKVKYPCCRKCCKKSYLGCL